MKQKLRNCPESASAGCDLVTDVTSPSPISSCKMLLLNQSGLLLWSSDGLSQGHESGLRLFYMLVVFSLWNRFLLLKQGSTNHMAKMVYKKIPKSQNSMIS